MKVRYIGDYYKVSLIKGKIYDVLSVECGWYRIVDETLEDYLFPSKVFEIVEEREAINDFVSRTEKTCE